MEFRKATDVFGEWAAFGKDVGMEKVHRETVVPFLSTFAFPESFSFLDFGCGNGWVVQKIAQMSACTRAVGFDGAPAMIERAKKKKQFQKEEYVLGDLLDWETEERFDVIFSMEALYYAVPMEPAVDKLVRLLSPGGQIVVGTNYFEENASSHTWPTDLHVRMDRRSIQSWKDMLVSAGLLNVTQKPVYSPNPKDSGKHGTLFTMGRFEL